MGAKSGTYKNLQARAKNNHNKQQLTMTGKIELL